MIFDAQKEAIYKTQDCSYYFTFHSDQDWRYKMKQYNIFQSMSRKGISFDNSSMENFLSILKQELEKFIKVKMSYVKPLIDIFIIIIIIESKKKSTGKFQ